MIVFVTQEENALLENRGHNDDSGNPLNLLYIPASELIEQASVIFYPNFLASYFGGRNHIVLSSQAFSHQSNNGNSSKYQSILETNGITEIIRPCENTSVMIGTMRATSVLNLLVSKVSGIGMLILPGSFAKVGWLAGTLLLLVSGAASIGTLFLLDWICETINTLGRENGNSRSISHFYSSINPNLDHDGQAKSAVPSETTASYAGVVAKTLGKSGSQILEALTLIYCLGQLLTCLGVISSQIIFLLSATSIEGIFGIGECIFFLSLGVIFPLSLFPEESFCVRMSVLFGIICITSIAFIIVFGDGLIALKSGEVCSLPPLSNHDDRVDEAKLFAWGGWLPLLQYTPLFLFCFDASIAYVPVRFHHQTCVGHLPSPTTVAIKNQETSSVILRSIVLIGSIYLSCSMVAYLAYCDGVPENVVDAWPLTWMLGSAARLLLVVELLAAVATIYVPLARTALWHLVCNGNCNKSQWSSRIILTLGLIGVGVIGSIYLDGAVVLPLVFTSAICVTAQMFVLPGLCAFALLEYGEKTTSIPYKSFMAIGLAAIGVLLGILCLAAVSGMLG